MFIIFGTPRSGTTLLATTLGQHDEIVIPDETDFIIPAAFIFDRVKDPVQGRRLIADLIIQTEKFPVTIGQYLSPAEVAEALAGAEYTLPALLQAVYARVAQAAGRRLAGDKSPNDLAYARMLLKHGLDQSPVKVVHVVRDVRDILMSLVQSDQQPAAELFTYFPRFWAQSNLFLQDMYAGQPAHYLFFRYEELVEDPAAGFRRITDFLGVPFQEKMLDPANRHRRYEGQEHHRNLNQPIQQRGGRWRETMPPEVQQRCVVQAREAFERFNYPLA